MERQHYRRFVISERIIMKRQFKQWRLLIPPISARPLILTELTEHKKKHVTLKIQVSAWERHTKVEGLNRLMGQQPSPLDNWISNDICKETITKTWTDLLPLKNTAYYLNVSFNDDSDTYLS